MKLFKLPDLGEGLMDAEIVEWHIKAGEQIKEDDLLVSVETAKAIVDLPSPQSGLVKACYGKTGDIVQVGDPLIEFELLEEENDEEKKPDTGTVVGKVEVGGHRLKETSSGVGSAPIGIRVTPAVRALAHRLDVDLAVITPGGKDGTITAADVQRVEKILSEVGPLEPLRGARRSMARNMEKSHAEVVAVTVTDDADIECWGASTDITLRLIRAISAAHKLEPALNTWYDSHSVGRRLIKDIHLGVAVDTPEGLFVPVVRNITDKTPENLRIELDSFKQLISKRKLPIENLRGQTFTLSNFGTFAGRYANPVVMPPAVAILGAGRARSEVVATNDGPAIHRILPLSLSFDHRVVTGGEASRFLGLVIDDLNKTI